ncbi:splicing factor 3a, subunit 1 [Geranomyces variabilis]|nr:splicing factor 3a, subunit 1 [Geranomyces variabilis]
MQGIATIPTPPALSPGVPASTPVPPNDGPAMIYPPPEIKNIVDKTADYVARSGSQFEDRIREREKHNPKFCFLNPTDPYRAYYDFKIKEHREGRGAEKKPDEAKTQDLTTTAPTTAPPTKPVPPEPPRYNFSAPLPSVSVLDLDILKLTAQFIARNGREFMTQLTRREMRNYQFDFLRSNHSLFPYFTKLVEQYTKLLMPPAGLLEDSLRVNVEDKFAVLKRIGARVEYRLYQEDEKKKAEDEADEERVAYASIDWHDFVIVDTVEFAEADERMNLNPPMRLEELEGMSLAQKKAALMFDTQQNAQAAADAEEDEMDVDMDMDMDMDMDED